MRLVDLDVTALARAPVSAVANARRAWATRRGLLLAIRDEHGHIGHGEASPLPGYSSESFATARRALKMWCAEAPPRLDLADARASVARLVAQVDKAVPSVRFAVETALLDLVGQRLDQPMWRLLRDEATGARPEPVALSGLVMPLEVDDAVAEARAAVARGLRTLKIKVGRPGQLDREMTMLTAVRAGVGGNVALRLDANGTLPRAQLETTLERLATVAPALIEEPVSGAELGGLEASPIPLAIDESLRHVDAMSWVEQVASRDLLAAVVLKPMALGGAFACLDWVRRTADLGTGAFVTHLFDGPVARAASAHLALALPGRRIASGLDSHPALVVWPPSRNAMLDAQTITPTEVPGLGLELTLANGDTP